MQKDLYRLHQSTNYGNRSHDANNMYMPIWVKKPKLHIHEPLWARETETLTQKIREKSETNNKTVILLENKSDARKSKC